MCSLRSQNLSPTFKTVVPPLKIPRRKSGREQVFSQSMGSLINIAIECHLHYFCDKCQFFRAQKPLRTQRAENGVDFRQRLCESDERLPRSSPGVASSAQPATDVDSAEMGGPLGRRLQITKSQSERLLPRGKTRRELCNALRQQPPRIHGYNYLINNNNCGCS